MACNQKTLLLISSYADGEATCEETARAIVHLETCRHCRKMVTDWQEQRQVLDWAYTFELPEQITLNTEKKQMSSTEARPIGINWRWNWVKPMAAAVVIAFILIKIMNVNPMLGDKLITGSKARSARMPGNIQLKVGPNSKITRINDHSIRLEQGWVAANVRHGTGFEVLTKRIRVVDKGTRFRVGAALLADVVTVDEGCVDVYKGAKPHRVNADQVLFAWDGEEPKALSFPAAGYNDDDHGSPIGENIDTSMPRSAEELEWKNGLRDLAIRFPGARIAGGYGSSSSSDAGKIGFVSSSSAERLQAGLRAHFSEIALALAGGETDDNWEIPVGFMQVDGIIDPVNLPADTYYIRLVSNGGKLVWRLSGAKGSDTDLPLSASKRDPKVNQSGGSFSLTGSFEVRCKQLEEGRLPATWVLLNWPGESQFALRLGLRAVSPMERNADKYTTLKDIARQTAGVNGLNIADAIKNLSGTMLYLDSQRKHWILVTWNNGIDKPFTRVRELHQQGSTGSAVMGAVSINTPLKEPKLSSGVYLLWWVWPGRSKVGHWEITTPDMHKKIVLSDKTGEYSQGSTTGGSYGEVCINYGTSADKSAYEFQFKMSDNTRVSLGEGRITVSKP
ncbi:MAG: zf-HC2 domain-containing protein [Armatimonadetes bacterium]|nr:zf-HC2 domain-containing protein [Armatimonadota bacterium]